MVTGMLTMVAANGLFLFAGAMLPPPSERPQFMEQSSDKAEPNSDRMVDRDELEWAVRRLTGKRLGPIDPRLDARPAAGPADQDLEFRLHKALERAMAQTLRRHRAEMDRMLREAVEQALREVGAPASAAGPDDRPGVPEKRRSSRQWQRGQSRDDGPGRGMAWRRWDWRWSDTPDGGPKMGPGCRHRCGRSPGFGMGRHDGPCCPGEWCRLRADGPRQGKWQDRRGPKADRFMRGHDRDHDGCVMPDEFKGAPKRFKKLDRNCDGKIDRKDWKEPRPQRPQTRECRDDDPPPSDE